MDAFWGGGKMYKKILKELKKGNAVLVEVKTHSSFRYRLLTSESCKYDYVDLRATSTFDKSCFMYNELLNPKNIIERMEKFDSDFGFKITEIQVLK
jgi:hypothetical protein